MGFRFSGHRIVPRGLLELRGVEIRGELLGVDYACFDCEVTFHHPAPSGPAPGC
jgi:hypothetical protein